MWKITTNIILFYGFLSSRNYFKPHTLNIVISCRSNKIFYSNYTFYYVMSTIIDDNKICYVTNVAKIQNTL